MGENSKPKKKPVKKGIFILGLIGLIGLIVGIIYYRYSQTHITTDDAYVNGNVYSLSFRIPGTVAKVMVHDNQLVQEGQVIAVLDPTDYEVALKQAQANLDSSKSRLMLAQIGVPLETEQTRARIRESSAGKGAIEKTWSEIQEQLKRAQEETKGYKAVLDKAALDRDRFDSLFKAQAISKQQLDNVLTQYKVAEAHYKGALAGEEAIRQNAESLKEQIARAEAQITLAQTGKQSVRIKQQTAKAARSELALAEARLEQARLQLSYTQFKAPAKGYITKKNIEVGNQIQAGQPLAALVPLENLWIVANYKETKLVKIKVGQKVSVKADSFPGEEITGRVNSIMAGTGSAFSLFPPENATGNYVKIVQRIPVKIVLDKGQKNLPTLRLGMSVVPTILVEN